MVRPTKGFRRETRRKLSAPLRHKFKVSDYMKEFRKNDRVVIDINPSSHRGMPFPKFQGKTGVILEKKGRAYVVEIKVGGKKKIITAMPEHLKIKDR